MIEKAMFIAELENNSYLWDSKINQWYVKDNDGNWIKEITTNKIKKLQNLYKEWCENGK